MSQVNQVLFPHGIIGAIKNSQFDPTGMQSDEIETSNQVFSYPESIIRVLGAYGIFDVERSLAQPETPRPYMLWITPASYSNGTITESNLKVYNPTSQTFIDMTPALFVQMIMMLAMNDITLLPNANASSRGMMTSELFKKIDGVEAGANKYTHPTGNGNKHVPPNVANVDEFKVMVCGKAEGETSWGKVKPNMIEWSDESKTLTKLEYDGLLALLNAAKINVTGDITLI
jgi:hypothetical protein